MADMELQGPPKMSTTDRTPKLSTSSYDYQLKLYRAYGTTAAVIALMIVTYLLIATDSPVVIAGTSPEEQTDCQALPCNPQSSTDQAQIAPGNDTVVQAFIAELREATKLAAGGEDEELWLNDDAIAKWTRENSCMSRTEMAKKYSRRKYVRDLDPSPPWQAILKEYAKLHRTCIRRIGDPTAYYMGRNTSVDCKFTVVDTATIGLGNRLLVMASAIAYSVLTKRVILLAGCADFIPPELLCEPFEGSSWVGFDVGRSATPFHTENQFWNGSGSFHSRIDAARKEGNGSVVLDYAVANSDTNNWVGQPESRFFCDAEQEFYKNVTWVYLTGMIYFLPKFFTVPSFRPLLEALFPDRMALTRILRDVILPADPVWTRVNNVDRGYLKQSDRRLGVQLRYRNGWDEYNDMHQVVAARVLQCAINNSILPPTVQNLTTHNAKTPISILPGTISVFMASLFEGVKDNLTETFLRRPTATGSTVQVIQLSHQGEQRFGADIFQEALAEVMILSFSDNLFVTPMSTFSGLAQAYGGLVPWFITWRGNNPLSGPCTRAQTVDVCMQAPYDYNIKCPYDPIRDNKEISDFFPDVQRCLQVDIEGLQLVTKNDLSMEQH